MSEGLIEREVRVESDDRLLLREFSHRTGNDYAAAVAAMRLSAAGAGPRGRAHLVQDAIARLEASSAVHLLLAAPTRRVMDAGALVRGICRKIGEARPEAVGSSMFIDAPEMLIEGEIARRVALIAAELVANAVKHALCGRAGVLTIRLDRRDGRMRLMVADDGAGVRTGAASSGTGWGGRIISELVARGGGSLAIDSGPGGTSVEVLLPLDADGGEAEIAF